MLRSGPDDVRTILRRILGGDPAASRPAVLGARADRRSRLPGNRSRTDSPRGRSCVFDFDLAEFPLFRYDAHSRSLYRFEPLGYEDEVASPAGGRIARSWLAVPGPAGVGGPSAQALLVDLIQLYAAQGGGAAGIRYGSMRSLLLRRGRRHPSARDFARLRRDLEILRGYEFRCRRSFWDGESRSYVDRTWRLFPADAHFDAARGGEGGCVLPVSAELAEIAVSRGFYPLAVDRDAFGRLTPLEQRLALYLGRKFRFQSLHRRRVDDLLRALPLHARRPRDARASLARISGRLASGLFPPLGSFRLDRSRSGRWLAEYARAQPGAPGGEVMHVEQALAAEGLRRIAEAIGSTKDAAWWGRCIERLGAGAVDRALGELREACRSGQVRNRGALLTTIFKDIAAERGIPLRGEGR